MHLYDYKIAIKFWGDETPTMSTVFHPIYVRGVP